MCFGDGGVGCGWGCELLLVMMKCVGLLNATLDQCCEVSSVVRRLWTKVGGETSEELETLRQSRILEKDLCITRAPHSETSLYISLWMMMMMMKKTETL